MKKVTYLLLVMFATILLTTSCEKDDVITPEEETEVPIITLEEFVGYWNFIQSEYNGETYTSCEDVENDPNVDFNSLIVDLDIELVPSNYIVDFNCYLDWLHHCTPSGIIGDHINGYDNMSTLDEKNNTFNLGNDIVFKILEYNKTTKRLIAKMIEPQESEYSPVGATYTWQKYIL